MWWAIGAVLLVTASFAFTAWVISSRISLYERVETLEHDVAELKEAVEVSATAQYVEVEPTVEEEPEPIKELWGNCRITAYCACEKCCGKWALNRPIDPATGKQIVTGARGTQLTSGYSVACSLPFGTILEIDGFDGMQFEVEDRTSQRIQDKYDGMTVDIYIDDHQECYKFMAGHSDWSDVYIVKEDET